MSTAIQLEVNALIEEFRFEQAGLDYLLQFPVVQDLVKRAIRVEAAAKNYATGVGGGPHVRTGRLRGSITWRVGRDILYPYVDVGTAVEYAPFVELGTRRMHARPYLRPALQAARANI